MVITEKYEKAALSELARGNYIEALNNAKIVEKKNPKVRLSYLIQGEIYFREGNLDLAQMSYEKALTASKGTEIQKSKALMGLGRIASLQNQTDLAVSYYKKSTDIAPNSEIGYLSQGLLLDSIGNSELNISERSNNKQVSIPQFV